MSKIILLFLAIFTLSFNYPQEVYAQSTLKACTNPQAETDPTSLFDTQRKAKFFINVGKTSDYSNWKVEFKCGVLLNKKEAATIEDENKISYTLDQTDYKGAPNTEPCEFSEGIRTIYVIAVNASGVDVPQCKTSYTVANGTANEDAQCKLSISPENGITSSTNLTLSGKDLRKDGKFVVFFDKTAVGFNPLSPDLGSGNVNTPTFSMAIPQELMSPGNHVISLRKKRQPGGIGGLNPFDPSLALQYAGPPLCTVSFSVGTPSNPGSVVTPGIAPVPGAPRPAGSPTTAGGEPCDEKDPNDPSKPNPNPGFKTAIGCIHTNPASLIKDVLGFVVGISGGLAFLMMILGAFQMLTSAGNPETLQAGRDRLQSAIIGLLFVIFAVLLLRIIGVDILGIPGFTK